MTISKIRGATKKLGPISTGNKIVRFKVSHLDRRFTVHEDLICRTSAYFKIRLQKNRKALYPTDECCVCAEALNPTTMDITFCVKCGQNIHETCIETWKYASGSNGGSGQANDDKLPPTCPMCRAPWRNDPLLRNTFVEGNLDADAVQHYLDYLYSGTLHICPSIPRKTDAFNLCLLQAWAVAAAVQDSSFKHAVIKTFFEEARARFWRESVEWAFVQQQGGAGNEEIKRFVVGVYMAYMKEGWFGREGAEWPGVFVRALADRALEGRRESFTQLRERYLGEMEKEDGHVDMGIQEEGALREVRGEERYEFVRGSGMEAGGESRKRPRMQDEVEDDSDRSSISGHNFVFGRLYRPTRAGP